MAAGQLQQQRELQLLLQQQPSPVRAPGASPGELPSPQPAGQQYFAGFHSMPPRGAPSAEQLISEGLFANFSDPGTFASTLQQAQPLASPQQQLLFSRLPSAGANLAEQGAAGLIPRGSGDGGASMLLTHSGSSQSLATTEAALASAASMEAAGLLPSMPEAGPGQPGGAGLDMAANWSDVQDLAARCALGRALLHDFTARKAAQRRQQACCPLLCRHREDQHIDGRWNLCLYWLCLYLW